MSPPEADPPSPPSRNTDRDVALVERLRSNDRDAMASLYDAYGRQAFGLAYRTVRDAKEAEDVVQEAFLTLWRQAKRIDVSRGSLKSLLLTIVHRRAVDVLRRRTARPEVAFEFATLMASPMPDPVEFAAAAEDQALVARALEALPSDQRQAIELTYFQGLTVAQMAERQQVPLGTAKSRLRLALERMRATLKESEPRAAST